MKSLKMLCHQKTFHNKIEFVLLKCFYSVKCFLFVDNLFKKANHFYDNLMLIKEIILFLAFFLIAQSAILANITETPVPYTNFSSPQFKKVLDAVKNQHLETTGWRPSRATKQTINQTKYKFRLVSDLGETVDVTAAINSQGAITVTDFSPIVGRRPFSQKANDVTLTNFKPFTDYSNSSFQTAIDQVRWQNFYLFVSYKLNSTQLFVSNRFYYFKFNFINRQNISMTIQIIECISFETPVISIPTQGLSGAFVYDNPDALDSGFLAYSELIDFDPSLAVYQVATVMSQNLKGKNYIFVLEKSDGGFERKKFHLTSTSNNLHSIAKGADDRSEGYSQQVVDQVEAYATRTWKDLQAFKLEKVENVRPDKTGLRLFYTKGTTIKFVELDLKGEDETLILYE